MIDNKLMSIDIWRNQELLYDNFRAEINMTGTGRVIIDDIEESGEEDLEGPVPKNNAK